LEKSNINVLEKLDACHRLVSEVFQIDGYTVGSGDQPFLVRYRGQIRDVDSAAAYDQLSANLRPLNITPLFRIEDERHVVLLIPGMPEPKPSNPWINLALFIATLFSVLLTGALYGLEAYPTSVWEGAVALVERGWPFAVSLLAILGAHEFGHYLAGRYHGVHVTLPYFIPFPFSPFGTMGAFINMKEPPRNRRVMLDISIAGPLAGLCVAIPVLLLGLSLSTLDVLPTAALEQPSLSIEGNSILYLFSKFLIFGELLPLPVSYGDLPPLLYWLRYFFTGQPFPWGGMDVMLHPVAWAGWAGLLVTALNLIPAGQLDGGHLFFVRFGAPAAKRMLPFILGGLVVLGFVWNGWWLWAGLVFLLGRRHAEPLDTITPLDENRRLLAVVALVVFVLTFTPVPLALF
jgi:membrane-associated protease RseP (regulator of RpoE activity)